MKEKLFWEKFWARVDTSGGPNACWIWKGSRKGGKDKNGRDYGYVWKARGDGSKRKVLAHRLAWEWYNEESAGKFDVLHKCDNPPCVNWRHLFLGTQGDNNRDMYRKGRGPVGERSGQAKLTANQVKEIQKLLCAGIWVADIARHYKVHHATIDGIKNGSQWKSLGVVKVRKRKAGPGVKCSVTESSPLRSCGLKAAVKVTFEGGGVQYLCSGHGLPFMLSPNSALGRGFAKAEAV